MLRRFIAEDSGATSIEYGLIAMGVSIACLVAIQAFASSLSDLWLYASSQVVSNID